MTKLLVYGTLRRGHRANAALKGCAYLGDVKLPGYDMYNLGGFPGIVPNPQNKEGIVGEVFDGLTPDVLDHLDAYEGYRPQAPERSNYLREEIAVDGDNMFVYVFNRPTDLSWYKPIPTGDWMNK